MPRLRLVLGAALLATAVAGPSQAQAPKSGTAEPSTTTRIETWTRAKWNAVKRELSRDKVKWDTCNERAAAQNLSGRKNWSYIYDCVKSQ